MTSLELIQLSSLDSCRDNFDGDCNGVLVWPLVRSINTRMISGRVITLWLIVSNYVLHKAAIAAIALGFVTDQSQPRLFKTQME